MAQAWLTVKIKTKDGKKMLRDVYYDAYGIRFRDPTFAMHHCRASLRTREAVLMDIAHIFNVGPGSVRVTKSAVKNA